MHSRLAAAAALMAALAVGAAAETVIAQGTLIKVVLDTAISTKTNKAGDTFTLHCADEKCGGFPMDTKFHGTLAAVRPKTDKLPGSADVTIHKAELPDGRMLAIVALPATEKGQTRPTVGGQTAKEEREKKGTKIGVAGGIILGPIGSLAGVVAKKKAPATPDDLGAKPGKKFHIKIMEAVTLP